MKKFNILFFGLLFLVSASLVNAQAPVRKEITVPKVDAAAITIDGNMNEAEWQNAAKADLVTNTGYNIFSLYYGREGLAEPEFQEYYSRMLWDKDTLFLYIHIDEVVNDSSGLYWNGQWVGDQLFVSLSNRFGIDLPDDGSTYDGNVYSAPDGPYHYLILGNQVTLNRDDTTFVPEGYRRCLNGSDSLKAFHAADYARWAIKIDTIAGTWNLEMAIYNPGINSQSTIGFNIGGSQGSWQHDPGAGDAYAYYTWQPNIPNEPFGDPFGNGDPGFYNLNNSEYWAVLNFTDAMDRVELDVPNVDPSVITIDGAMNESEWQNAGNVDLVTNTGYNIFSLYYGREGLAEPEFDEYYSRLLWSKDTLYAFIHIDEVVNDSSGLYWNGQWVGDQLFVSLSNRLGVDLADDGASYDGNVYATPDGPYHFLILGNDVTLNNNAPTYVPEEYRGCFDDSTVVFNAADWARWAIVVDTINGVWNLEMAIFNPDIAAQSKIGFNIGGSQGSWQHDPAAGDAYAYYTWQPNIPNNPFGDPFGNGDPGFYNLNNSEYFAMLNFKGGLTGIEVNPVANSYPEKFNLHQNYPNPFNPSTTIKFDITRQSPVTLKVYNVIGQLVATLVNGEAYNAGTYSVRWDASSLASGMYLYRLEAEGKVSSMKMMLLK